MSTPSNKLSYHVPCTIEITWTIQPNKQEKRLKHKNYSQGREEIPNPAPTHHFATYLKPRDTKQIHYKLPFKISPYTTLFHLLQHLEPKIKDFCRNTKFMQYAKRQSCIIVESICNLHKNSEHLPLAKILIQTSTKSQDIKSTHGEDTHKYSG